jgi:hypothetical protein
MQGSEIKNRLIAPLQINGEKSKRLTNALFMTILTQTFLSLVGGHFMALTLFSAWHYKEII